MADSSDWEVLKLPLELEIANKNRQSGLPRAQENSAKDDEKERLCGYLNKLGAKGIKTWKRRWFVFEPRRCMLYYYKTPDCAEPLGNIDIANATFSVTVNPSVKGFFEIRSLERVYSLQAADKEAAQFWLQELKAERAKFIRLQSSQSSSSKSTNSVMRPTSGLLSSPNDGPEDQDESTNDLISFAEPVKKPATVGEATRSESNPPFSNISISNLKTELKNWRKSMSFNSAQTGEALKNDHEERGLATIAEKPFAQKNVKLREGRTSRSVDFGFMKMSAALKRRTFWGNQPFPVEQVYGREGKEFCPDCEEVKEILSTLKEAIQIAEKEIKTRDEVLESLHEQIRQAVTSKQESNSPNNDAECIEEKDHYIKQLSKMVQKFKTEMEILQTRLDDKDNQLTETNKKVDVLQELVTTKDNEIITLTNQIFTIEHPETGEQAYEEIVESGENEPQRAKTLDSDQLQEINVAYKEQNKLLNSEIIELMKLRSHDKDIIRNKESTITSLEAELCKIKSRYILLLKEFSVPQKGNERDQGMIQHLLDDAINQENRAEKSPKTTKSADRYGFYETIDTEDEDALQTYSERLDEKSSDNTFEGHDMSAGVKWENFLVAQGTKPIQRSEEIKTLVRGGIPHEFRARVWMDFITLYVKNEREAAGEGYFESLLEDKKGSYTPAEKQIELDLLRTLPNNKFYDRVDSEGTNKLRRVLLAYSWHNAKIGYCQGLNRLGAIALLYLEEENAFWCLVAILDYLMPRDYYTKSLTDAQVDQRVFKDLLDEKLPKLSQLFQNLSVDLSLLSFNWFLAVFVDIFPIELTLRIWDTFLYEGNKVLFRYSLAIFKSCEEDLLRLKECGEVYKFFRRIPSQRLNPHRISQIAFQQMNPFPKRNIITKRNQHKPKVEADLAEFEELRRDRSERETSHENVFSDGEDED